MVEMKGQLITLSVFLVLMGIIVYITLIVISNTERTSALAETMSAQRVYYSWKAVDDNFAQITEAIASKFDDTAQINDTLPANISIEELLKQYQEFVETKYADETMRIRFEDPDGNYMNLSKDLKPQITIKPMNIVYSWPDWGKNEMNLNVDPSNFSYIKNITILLEANGNFTPTYKQNPKECPADYCLNLTLKIYNKSYEWVYPYSHLDIKFDNWIFINVNNQPSAIKIYTGQIDPPAERVINMKFIKDAVLQSSTSIKLNTTDFYISYLAKINVSTPFGAKVDWI